MKVGATHHGRALAPTRDCMPIHSLKSSGSDRKPIHMSRDYAGGSTVNADVRYPALEALASTFALTDRVREIE